MNIKDLLLRRPAESTSSVASIIAGVVLYLAHVHDDALLIPLAVVLGHIPAAVTWVVELWRARKGATPSA